MGIISILAGVAGPVVGYLQRRSELKAEALNKAREIEGALQSKKLESIDKAESYDAAWNMAQIQNSGWKDEYWTIILSIPMVLCFVPKASVYVLQGFEVLKSTPLWYQGLVGTAVLAGFGLKMTDKVWKWWASP